MDPYKEDGSEIYEHKNAFIAQKYDPIDYPIRKAVYAMPAMFVQIAR